MDEGRRFGRRKLLRFNGHFFQDRDVIPLERDDLAVLLRRDDDPDHQADRRAAAEGSGDPAGVATSIYYDILRMADLLALQPNLDIRL
jgi:hypothetical protein